MEFDHVLQYIRKMNALEIDQAMNALISRKRELYTDWEIFYLAIPKNDPAQRRQTLEMLRTLLAKENPLPD